MALTLHIDTRSPLHRLHPVTKLLGLVAFVIAAFLVNQPLAILPLSVGMLSLLALGGGLENVRRFRLMLVLVFVFTLVIWTLFYQTVMVPTWTGFVFGLSTAIRLCTFFITGLVFLSTTRIEEVAYGL